MNNRIRIYLDGTKATQFTDAITQGPVKLWNGDRVDIEVAAGYGETLRSLAGVVSLTLDVKAGNKVGDALIRSVVSEFHLDCTYAEWAAGTSQQAVFELGSAATGLDVGNYWGVIYAHDADGEKTTLGAGVIQVMDDAVDNGPAPAIADLYLLAAVAGALYIPKEAVGQNFRVKDGQLQLLDDREGADPAKPWVPMTVSGFGEPTG